MKKSKKETSVYLREYQYKHIQEDLTLDKVKDFFNADKCQYICVCVHYATKHNELSEDETKKLSEFTSLSYDSKGFYCCLEKNELYKEFDLITNLEYQVISFIPIKDKGMYNYIIKKGEITHQDYLVNGIANKIITIKCDTEGYDIHYLSRYYSEFEKLVFYRNQILNSNKLEKTFNQLCDLYFKDEDDLIEDLNSLLENGNYGTANYSTIYPFAKDSSGNVYVLLNYRYVGVVTHERKSGMVANNLKEFFNIISVCKNIIDLFKGKAYEKFENFKGINETLNLECDEVNLMIEDRKATDILEDFIEDNSFSKDNQELYEIFRSSVYERPAFIIQDKNNEYEDYDSLVEISLEFKNEVNKSMRDSLQTDENAFFVKRECLSNGEYIEFITNVLPGYDYISEVILPEKYKEYNYLLEDVCTFGSFFSKAIHKVLQGKSKLEEVGGNCGWLEITPEVSTYYSICLEEDDKGCEMRTKDLYELVTAWERYLYSATIQEQKIIQKERKLKKLDFAKIEKPEMKTETPEKPKRKEIFSWKDYALVIIFLIIFELITAILR